MRRETILIIWVAGLVLAVLLYLIGPDRFIDTVVNFLDSLDVTFRNLVATLGVQAYGVVRALAIAFYLVFLVLAVLASQRGRGGFWMLVIVTIVCGTLVWRPFGIYPAPLSRWLGTLIVVLIASAILTKRLLIPPRFPESPPPPYPPGRFS